ncbi:hypothetical protein AQ837_30380 [Burkholderia pseudomallei]|nr:hypothetical protein AQ819_00090 [Burkholderia pseudomallei]OMY15339.1 hypothetical protein AQ837_30380 [Burkholderia pseudomallei]OMY15734.1 hypothetical protein AQ838_02690 [Burkholderia pseudomallei]OMY24887.1 hypothetical protein AQ840_06480 [Burkholderia pseudomallei]OMY30420.1 hypothetical protein AQ839_28425 [Burkholderia pseudomallei]
MSLPMRAQGRPLAPGLPRVRSNVARRDRAAVAVFGARVRVRARADVNARASLVCRRALQ